MAVTVDLEPAIRRVGEQLAAGLPRGTRSPRTRAERLGMRRLTQDPALKAALLRFVDVRPACRDDADLVTHLRELLAEADGSPLARGGARIVGRPGTVHATARAAGAAVHAMAGRFIAGTDAAAALPGFADLWRRGLATTVDLLGEATVTEAEADRYAARCDRALRDLAAAAARWPAAPLLEADAAGPLPRANLSVKVSALTPLLRPAAPWRGADGARDRLRALLRTARDVGAHLHVDLESFDTREAVVGLVCELLAEPEFAAGPSAGIVLQAYLAEAPEHLEELLAWTAAHPRAHPLTVRLVKGAYWDHEIVEAAQHGWAPPVLTDRAACDRAFEALTRRLLGAFPDVRTAVASHNLRSVAAALAVADHLDLGVGDLELQVLRGLGDDTGAAIARLGRRVRVYAPVGDLVAGMAYLVRRLLENTANDSFLAAQASGRDLDELLAAP
jgi:RHH-type proline utilization regulon transcriptional repressor/proline dehydrogenase/delta 1-pyrroline-5-carboxylate dehydrogenase